MKKNILFQCIITVILSLQLIISPSVFAREDKTDSHKTCLAANSMFHSGEAERNGKLRGFIGEVWQRFVGTRTRNSVIEYIELGDMGEILDGISDERYGNARSALKELIKAKIFQKSEIPKVKKLFVSITYGKCDWIDANTAYENLSKLIQKAIELGLQKDLLNIRLLQVLADKRSYSYSNLASLAQTK